MDPSKSRKRKPSSSPPVKRRIKKIKEIESSETSSFNKQNVDDSNSTLRGKGFCISSPTEGRKGRGHKVTAQNSIITSFFGKGSSAKVPDRKPKEEVIEVSTEKSLTKEIPKAMDWELEEAAVNSQGTEELPDIDENLISNLNNVNFAPGNDTKKPNPMKNPPKQQSPAKANPAKSKEESPLKFKPPSNPKPDRTATARQNAKDKSPVRAETKGSYLD